MGIFFKITGICIALLLIGCDTVTSLNQVGQLPLPLVKEQWQGAWLVENDVVHIKVIDESKGHMLLYVVDVDAGVPDKVVQSYKVYVRKSSSSHYLNLLDNDPSVEGYFFAKFKRDDNQIQLWLPANKSIHKAVKSGTISGKTNQNDSSILLQATAQELDKFFAANPDAFDVKPIWVMTRITNKKDTP